MSSQEIFDALSGDDKNKRLEAQVYLVELLRKSEADIEIRDARISRLEGGLKNLLSLGKNDTSDIARNIVRETLNQD